MNQRSVGCVIYFNPTNPNLTFLWNAVVQGEQVRQLLEEKRQRHCRQLIAAVELGFSRKLREKDLEAEKVKYQNQELLDRLQHLSAESINWQNKLRQSEQNVNLLRSSIQQASQHQPYALNREQQSKEGCGDSEVDDCASSYVDDRIDAHARTFNENKELREQWTCRVCRCKDVSMLLLPCRHLCLCKDCEGQLDACPLCRAPKNASVQVYMS
jgi:E3 ubiquitin-protein ligase BOI-like protein